MNLRMILIGAAVALGLASASAGAATLIDGTTQGLYNNGIGTLLNGTSSVFPTAGDPVIDIPASSPPDLSAAAVPLGNWLTNPASPGGAWSGPMNIPATWAVGTESAIIYEIDAGTTGLSNVLASFGVDNGIFVWLNGVFLGGQLRPGGSVLGEFNLDLGTLAAGSNYLQILREDHGGATGYNVLVTGDVSVVPLPGALVLLLSGLAGLGYIGQRRRTAA